MSEYIFKSYDNIIELQLTEDSVPLEQDEYDTISRMTLLFGSALVDSDTAGEGSGQPFDWTSDAKLRLDLGKLTSPTIPAGTYDNVKHVVYTPDNPNGIVWGYLQIIVV